jgi:hypothetical protein
LTPISPQAVVPPLVLGIEMGWKDARHMSNVCNEIIESERNYINDLQVKILREKRTEKGEQRM